MKIYVIEYNFGGQAFVTGAWKTKPTTDEVKDYMAAAFPGVELVNYGTSDSNCFVKEFTVYSNVRTHLRKTRR